MGKCQADTGIPIQWAMWIFVSAQQNWRLTWIITIPEVTSDQLVGSCVGHILVMTMTRCHVMSCHAQVESTHYEFVSYDHIQQPEKFLRLQNVVWTYGQKYACISMPSILRFCIFKFKIKLYHWKSHVITKPPPIGPLVNWVCYNFGNVLEGVRHLKGYRRMIIDNVAT